MRLCVFLLFLIVTLGFFIRFYRLEQVPPSLSLDEVSIGYNAYSILKTGADEYGYRFPVLLRAYDDWRPALYVYLVIPFVAIFGLTPFAVRFPSVLLGIITLCITYKLSKEFFFNDKPLFSLITVFLLAISPWHIYISRLGHEANLGHTATIIFIYLLVRWISEHRSFLLYSTTGAAVVALYGYQSQKVVIPFILLGFAVLYYSHIIRYIKHVVLCCIAGIIFLLPLINASIQPQALIRLSATSAFRLDDVQEEARAQKYAQAIASGDFIKIILYHYRTQQLVTFTSNYIVHFNPKWLLSGDKYESHKVPYMGLLYTIEALLLIVGIVFIFKDKKKHHTLNLFMLTIFSAPLPAAISTQAPHAMRAYTLIPFLQIISAYGAYSIFRIYKGLTLRILVPIFIIIIFFGIKILWVNYFYVFPKVHSGSFQYAYTQALMWLGKRQYMYDYVVISNSKNLYQSYMFYLFYTQFNPSQYQSIGGTISGGFNQIHSINNVYFRPINWQNENMVGRVLYIGNLDDFPYSESSIITFTNLDGKEAVKVVEKNFP